MRFLAFEGLDGSGKSTLMKALEKELTQRGQRYVVTREPGGTELGREIRQMLLRVTGEHPVPRSEALLYQADRAQHVERLIKPALARGQWVLSDRFAASSVAFQSEGRDLQRGEIDWLNAFSTGGLRPDLYILLDLSVEESQRRMVSRGEAADRFESEDASFHQKVRRAYLALAAEEPKRWLVLSADHSPEQLLAEVLEYLKGQQWLG